MKIVTSVGKELKLFPDTVLEMQRVNPFFNDYGEQSLPVTLPDDGYNRSVLGWPNDPANTQKAGGRTDASIQDGAFHIACRQAILSAGGGSGIETSFYCNEGSFYERIEDMTLAVAMKDQRLSFANIDAAVSYVQSLMSRQDDKLACFPVAVENQDTGDICIVNRPNFDVLINGKYGLANAYETTEEVNGAAVTVPAGFYVSPQIRVFYVLKEAFRKMGYTLDPGFLGETEPFASMVLLNTNIDTVVNAEIRFEQLVPDGTVSDLMTAIRSKFCCEFIPDETDRTVRIVLFNEVMEESAPTDLSASLVGEPTMDHSQPFRQLKLSGGHGPVIKTEVDDTNHISRKTLVSADYLSDTIAGVRTKYQNLCLYKSLGHLAHADSNGFHVVGSLACDYCAESEGLETEEVSSPDVTVNVAMWGSTGYIVPVAGTSRCLNSRIVYDSGDTSGGDSQTDSSLDIMLCGVVHKDGLKSDYGTVCPYYTYVDGRSILEAKAWDYSLQWNGQDGLFERFWRTYDLQLRNGLRTVTANLLLTDVEKMTVPSYRKVILKGQELLPDVINYVVGKKRVTECSFRSTRILLPATSAPSWTYYYDRDV